MAPGSPYSSRPLREKLFAFLPIGARGMYVPGPGTSGSGPRFVGCITYFLKASLGQPIAWVVLIMWLLKVEVVLSGLNTLGTL